MHRTVLGCSRGVSFKGPRVYATDQSGPGPVLAFSHPDRASHMCAVDGIELCGCSLKAADPCTLAYRTALRCSRDVPSCATMGPRWGATGRSGPGPVLAFPPDRASHLCAVDGMGPEAPCPGRDPDTTRTRLRHGQDTARTWSCPGPVQWTGPVPVQCSLFLPVEP